nr:c6 finger domain transcription factor nscr [Quercus suber]
MTLRKEDHSRRVWTLAAVAVRIAHALELHRETTNHTPFEIELRRRVWHGTRFLDTFAAFDRGTEILVGAGSFSTPDPSNINDHEWDESSTEIKGYATGLTESSFTLLTCDSMALTQRLHTAEVCPIGMPWKQRLEIAQQFGATIHDKYIQYCDMSVPFHRLIYSVGKSMAASAILRAVRPMQRHVSNVPPRVDSPYVLTIALDCLRESEKVYNDPGIDQWRWLVWVPWHALAVCLAGLCTIRGTELSESAWPIVDSACQRHSQYIADTRNGMLWRPIEKLYRKAKVFREDNRRVSGASSSQTTPSPQSISPQMRDTNILTSMTQNQNLGYPSPVQHVAGYGSIPIESAFSESIDFGGLSNAPITTNDMGWTDWEKIMDDFSAINPNMNADMAVELQQMSMNGNGLPMTEQGKWNASGFGGMM